MTRPPTRWELGKDANPGYGRRFADLIAAGTDIDGEARLADVLAPRGARLLDAGSGMGRVAAALQSRGHRVTAIEPDPDLVAQSRRTYPDLAVTEVDILGFTPEERFDLVVLVGNVMVYLAEGTERDVLAHVRDLLAPDGRVLVGFHPQAGPANARRYPTAEFVADAESAGLRVEQRFGTYDLRPATEEYAVWVLTPA